MRYIVIIAMVLLVSCSRRVIVSGTALATEYPVLISVNDNLRKMINDGVWIPIDKLDRIKYRKLMTKTNKQGWFTINPKKTDSLTFLSLYHYPQSHAVKDLPKHPYIKLDEIPCEFKKCNDTVNDFYAILARKIEVKRAEQGYCKGVIRFDSEYSATYEVLENLYGDYGNDTINFRVFDHYGKPAFEEYDNILIYISEACDVLYHVKYQYAPIYRTADGRWASPYSTYYYTRDTDSIIKPQKIEFLKEVSFSIKDMDSQWVKKEFPEPYYKIEGNKAIAVYGNYVEDMFNLAKPVLEGFNIHLE